MVATVFFSFKLEAYITVVIKISVRTFHVKHYLKLSISLKYNFTSKKGPHYCT